MGHLRRATGLLGAALIALSASAAALGAEELRIRVVNAVGGEVSVSRDAGVRWARLGTVVQPALRVDRNGFTASAWAQDSAVCATAVNAIHIRIGPTPGTGRVTVFSIIPAGPVIGAAGRRESARIETDIVGGEGIFGAGLGPYVNSPVLLETEGGAAPLPADYVPRDGDRLIIVRQAPRAPLRYIEFENRHGGLIRAIGAGGEAEIIGQVLRPVVGVGRFPGGVDAACGRLRANHPGVIDVSTSPLGYQGGFQIIPREHAESPELWYVKERTQWMVVGPLNALDPPWEGQQPLFAGHLAPSYRPDDIAAGSPDWMNRLLSRCQVQARVKGGPWGLLPRVAFDTEAVEGLPQPERGRVWWIRASLEPNAPMPAVANTALRDVTHIRIALPWRQFWPEQERRVDVAGAVGEGRAHNGLRHRAP